ncbi:sigma-54-dependent transcriptional regulator [Aeromonas allosaccharophila]|uniref:sigma-54-dependent transcriptional regulator n=1 Tax=Aeromonas allosaccharophila TaxID=656 RepID=UPI0036DDCCF0
MTQARILVVEDDNGLREALVDTLLLGGYECREADCGERALLALSRQPFDMVISDIQMGGMDGLTLLATIRQQYPQIPVLLMTAYANIDGAVRAMREGAIDYLAKPFSPEVLLNQVSRYVPAQKVEKRAVVYGDPKTAELFQLATRVARSEATVMVTGPSGTGKEVLARYIHDNSNRAEQPFVAINCAAIPENMLEATLFGYEKGAFTGAVQGCPGKFEQAQGGTLLLDEITEMDQGLQAKLLRVLQEKEVERLGSRKMIPLDVRVIATSNRDLKKAVQDGLFREDLYYRLNVFPLRWSALCERLGDILPLAEHLLALHASQQGLPTPQLTDASRDRLLAHPWPGNVRELDNVVQRALILSPDGVIDCDHLILEELDEQEMEFVSVDRSYGGDRLGSELKQQEHQIILDTLQDCNGSRKAVADRLGISPRTLRYKLAQMREAGIDLPA